MKDEHEITVVMHDLPAMVSKNTPVSDAAQKQTIAAADNNEPSPDPEFIQTYSYLT